jgi:hypothetical protein
LLAGISSVEASATTRNRPAPDEASPAALTADEPAPDTELEEPEGPEPEAEERPPVDHYDDLESEEIIALLGSLEAHDLSSLRDYEREARARPSVISAIDAVLARRGAATRG